MMDERTDEELIVALRDGEKANIDIIMDKYKNLVRNKAKSMYVLGAEPEDLIQEGMIGLFKAVRDFDIGRDASFSTFANLCISRQMLNVFVASNRQKNIPLNTYVSLYSRENEDSEQLIDSVPSDKSVNPEEVVIDKENVLALQKAIEESLSSFEKQVLDLYMTGMTSVETAKVLGKDEKSTDNALQRAKSKVKRIIF